MLPDHVATDLVEKQAKATATADTPAGTPATAATGTLPLAAETIDEATALLSIDLRLDGKWVEAASAKVGSPEDDGGGRTSTSLQKVVCGRLYCQRSNAVSPRCHSRAR